MSQTYDVIIIGAGIMGSATAFELAKRGLKVALLDKKGVGAGGTGQSSAIIRQHYSKEITIRMAKHSLGVFQNFTDLVGGECGFTQTGFLLVADTKDMDGLKANIALQQKLGIKTELIDQEMIHKLMPALKTSDLVAAAFEPESGYADPYLTVTSYANAAKRESAALFQDTPVTGIRFDGGKVSGVDTPKGSFNAPLVLNSTGAWSAQVAKMAGVTIPIDSCRVQVAFFRRPAGHEAGHPVFADFINATYFRSETGGLTLVGLVDPDEANAIVDPDNFREGMDDDFVMDVGERLVRRFPVMEQSQVTGGYASLYAITPDWYPIIDELIPGSGFYVCSGFSGHGFKLGPAVSVMMADRLTGVSDPLFDTHLFRLEPLCENDLVCGQYEYSIVG
ncbi:MAG: FAD-binding oxidoreductase [Ardenticatenaceae bacterium]|nr:FAD-binding oxidoreductase [Ardenticatenaceae bacterium]